MPYSHQVWYTADLGSGWAAPALVSALFPQQYQYAPQIAMDGSGNAHVVWYGYNNSDTLPYLYATNAGGTWSDPARLSTQSRYDQYNPQIALDSSGNAYVVWYGYDLGTTTSKSTTPPTTAAPGRTPGSSPPSPTTTSTTPR